MKKKIISIILFVCAVLLTVGFVVHLSFDYTLRYKYGSAPFGIYIIERFLEYMILAIVCFIVGMVLQKKSK